MVDQRPWPIFVRVGSLNLFLSTYIWMSRYSSILNFYRALFSRLVVFTLWIRDITREGTFQGAHTMKIVSSLKFSMILFIISEVFFFLSFFWAFFHRALRPNIEVGCTWPPEGINPLNPIHIPFLNTLVLLTSGVSVTISHHALLEEDYTTSALWLVITTMLGAYFTVLQIEEYTRTSFTLSDSIFGSVFFLTTGFHGLHVIIGGLFLSISLIRLVGGHISIHHHSGFELARWYWHFVDLVWLFVYTLLYWWGG